jgi:peptide deformylase
MLLSPVDKNDPILKQKINPFVFGSSIDPVEIARSLTELAITADTISLSAPQCGIDARVFVILADPVLACFNPKIVDSSEEQLYLEEKCLTFPNVVLKVKRPKKIRVRFTMANGMTETRVFDGLTARHFQQQIDHLDGVLFTQRATLFHREQAFKRAKLAS